MAHKGEASKGGCGGSAKAAPRFTSPTPIARDVYFLDFTFKPGGNTTDERPVWQRRSGKYIPDLYRLADSGEYDFFVDGTRKDGDNVFAKHVQVWSHLTQIPCKFFGWIVQAGGVRINEEDFDNLSSKGEQRRRSTLCAVRKALALSEGPPGSRKRTFRYIINEDQTYRFEVGESQVRVGVLLRGEPAHWMQLQIGEPFSSPLAPPVAAQTLPSSRATEAHVLPSGTAPSMGISACPAKPAFSYFIIRRRHETAVEITVTNSGGTCFFKELRLFDESGAIPWAPCRIGELREGSQRLQRGRPYLIPSDSVWSGTVYVHEAAEQRLLAARVTGTLRLQIVFTDGDDAPSTPAEQ